jgi:hypothetical protein
MLSPEEQKAWIDDEAGKIYRVLVLPPQERVMFVRKGRSILVGDFGFHTPLYSPPERVGKFITLTGCEEDFIYIWIAHFLPTEVEFITRLDDRAPRLVKPYEVQKP